MFGKAGLVKNKTAAPVQITAEQLLREAVDRQATEVEVPRQRIVDADELQDYRVRKRKEYEDYIRRQRQNIGMWVKYATWEAGQKEFRRARSIFERALQVDYKNVALWLKYIEMEVRNKFVNSARNLYDRVVQLLPRVDQFWFKYAHMEELLGNFVGARAVFERWMEWEPEEKSWMLYIKFEERCGELERARRVFERFLSVRPYVSSFLKFCKFEERHRDIERARAGFEKAIEVLHVEDLDEDFYIKFASFEERQREFDRSKAIYKLALERLPKSESEELYRRFVSFQKRFGEKEEIEDVVVDRRRFFYEDELKKDPRSYDTWFDYIRLEESAGNLERIREVYERAIANVPPINEKRFWKRYIYIWYSYAMFEELQTGDAERTRQVYDKALALTTQKGVTFAKLYAFYAEFEVRQLQIQKARLIFGRALGECGKEKVFTAYAELELKLGEIDRCRKIYAKWVEMQPSNPRAWTALIDLEVSVQEMERARAIAEIAIGMEYMDAPEQIWKAYIELEAEAGEDERVRSLYERLLEKTQHFKVFKGYAEFELRQAGSIENARKVLQRGDRCLKNDDLKEERALLRAFWLELERENGDKEGIKKAFEAQPKRVRRMKNLIGEDGTKEGLEEVVEPAFPDDEPENPAKKILEKAKAWKKRKQMEQQATAGAAAASAPAGGAYNAQFQQGPAGGEGGQRNGEPAAAAAAAASGGGGESEVPAAAAAGPPPGMGGDESMEGEPN
uniref:Suppressor of forked domain-containing protein n=1 Tax=Chromera velia CCMP2878 TaxID=1169474 RepID=A0A0G4FV76_9ALVE|eukprot:Cvel_473.t1-p1 / transcript=Cvel_473.t1 / gene=Cvel_473 / organism=Chromera_velia_CCMP2878 / gene_product=Crooked neck-like protein 1, putative / transcript_product=Crooked neck-like protein 1, putative / location=Cvel_scaffold15:39766-46882(+) / protein_length=736 / sequence_SO=supercontig / SO=protein_coding / is_pseudo=false